MTQAAFSGLLIALVLLVTWYTVYASNKDLARAKAWGDLARRSAPLLALLFMAVSLLALQSQTDNDDFMLAWLGFFAVLITVASVFSISSQERRANRAFRRSDFDEAVRLYREISEEKPLARNYAFYGAALGASEKLDESIEASTKAIEKDPEYGLAYYNRALVLLRQKKKSRARKDFERASNSDIPRRFKKAIRQHLEDLEK
ncbi:MAG: tetratricopeptide repeat protein [Rubrobacteraceae bacterium]